MDSSRRVVLEEATALTPTVVHAPGTVRAALESLHPREEPTPTELPAELPRQARRQSPRALMAGIGLGATLLLLQTLSALSALLHQSPVLGVAWSAVFVLVLGAGGRAAWGMWRKLRRLRFQQDMRTRVQELQMHNGLSEARNLCDQLATEAGQLQSPAYLRWREQLGDTHNDCEVLRLYGRTVLAEADARALERVSSHAGDVAVMVAVSYFPAVDMLLVLWRQMKLVEEISGAYGMDPGYWGRIQLLRKVLRNMALAGAAEIATEVGVEVLGAGVTARLSAAAAQGVAAGVLTARLGLRTMDACRAIAWEEGERPRLRQVTDGVLEKARRFLVAGDSDG